MSWLSVCCDPTENIRPLRNVTGKPVSPTSALTRNFSRFLLAGGHRGGQKWSLLVSEPRGRGWVRRQAYSERKTLLLLNVRTPFPGSLGGPILLFLKVLLSLCVWGFGTWSRCTARCDGNRVMLSPGPACRRAVPTLPPGAVGPARDPAPRGTGHPLSVDSAPALAQHRPHRSPGRKDQPPGHSPRGWAGSSGHTRHRRHQLTRKPLLST